MSRVTNPHSVVVVGSGNVAESIAVAVADSFALELKQVVARNAARAEAVAQAAGCDWTTDMEEAADADYVVILDGGVISAEGTPLELKNTYTGDFITLYGVDEDDVRRLGAKYERLRDAYRISVPNTAKSAVCGLTVTGPSPMKTGKKTPCTP